MTLSYLFTCHFTDGTTIQQTQADVSQIDSSRSAFYDVAQRLGDVTKFVLSDGRRTCAVDLRDGHFEIDGFQFFVPVEGVPEDHSGFKLIYFRRNFKSITMGKESSSVEYHLGWQTTINGKNFQRTIKIC
jgi:hypothetical protein